MSLLSGIFGNQNYGDMSGIHSDGMNSGKAVNSLNNSNSSLSSLSAGQMIEGKILASDGESVQLELSNGEVVNARMDQLLLLQKGQNVIFEVRGNSGTQLSLSPMYTNMDLGATAWKALQAANMPVNATTLSMTTAMMDAGMGIDKASLGDMYHSISPFCGENSEQVQQGANPADLVQMKQLGIEIKEETITRFSAFKNFENQIGESIGKLASDITGAYDSLVADGKDEQALQFLQRVVRQFLEVPADGMMTEEKSGSITEDLLKNMPESLKNSSAGQENVMNKSVEGSLEKIILSESMQENSATAGEVAGNNLFGSLEMPEMSSGHLYPTLKADLLKMMKEIGVNDEVLQKLQQEPATKEQVLQLTEQLLDASGKENILPKLKSFLSSEGFRNALQEAVQKQLLLEPSKVAEKETVEKLYQRLEQQTRMLTESLSEIADPKSELAMDLSRMNQNLDFMHQMNQVYQYIQLPLKMHGGEATGDLFVYSDKKSLASKDGNVSALLHLDMQNLGMLDVYASMTEGKNVFTRFYLESDELISFMEENISMLDERLAGRGYHLKSEITKQENKKDVLTPSVSSKTGTVPKTVAKYGFDIRA